MKEDTPPTATMRGLDDQEESVRIAVKALGDMRNMNSNTRSRAPSYSQSQSESHSQSHNTKLPPIILPPLSISTSPSNKSDNNNSFSSSIASSSVAGLPSTSTSSSGAEPGTSISPPPSSTLEPTASSPAFVSRMSHFPLVGSALRVYEQGKASSRVVKYGAEMVESSVKSISRPVIDRLPVNVNQLDEFACRQLDRLDKYRRPSTSGEHPSSPADANPSTGTAPSPADRDRGRPKLRSKTLDGSAVADDDDDGEMQVVDRIERGGRSVPKWLEGAFSLPFFSPPPPPPDSSPYGYSSSRSTYSRGSTPTRDGGSERERSSSSYANANNSVNGSHASSSTTTENGSERQVAQRSRWQAVLLEAGGLSAALSEESMRRLKYCLQWLQYATAHIDAQILILRDFTASLQTSTSSSTNTTPPRPRPPISEEHMRKLIDVRRDIVHTIRQVVDVVSKYAGGALPEPARGRVRGFILKLPQRWASRAGGDSASGSSNIVGGEGDGGRDREREVVAAAAGSGTGVVRRAGGQRRAAQRERGVDSGSSASASMSGPGSGMRSGASSAAVSPSSSPSVARAVLGGGASGGNGHGGAGGAGQTTVSATAALVASQRILTLATESLDMMRNVTGVVKDSLDRADAWVGRLRTVGIQRNVQDGDPDVEGSIVPSDSATVASSRDRDQDFEFEFSDRMRYRPSHYSHNHSRKGSTQSDSVQSSVEMEVDMERDLRERDRGERSPFFSAASSTAWGSSIPSTPGVGVPAHLAGSGSGSGGLSRKESALSMGTDGVVGVHSPSASVSGLPIGVGAMSLGSRYGTPKSGIVGLPEEGDGDVLRDLKGDLKGGDRYGDVAVVDGDRDMDREVKREAKVVALREEEEEEGMDVDDVGA
ncbi:hypothetical protein CVT25_001223 [Psilocybe cyanescens]|uniref:Opi1-domain-containing protein n=1 Tax=Psilocybe cyanescens TaxID=93625 RepID=A0A409XKC9_PSICY|nr:hypothetical protein CVT25_001223 [Psilocybe cyanescens]